MRIYVIWVTFGLSNFLYQALTHQIWADAIERTFFQGGICLVIALTCKTTARGIDKVEAIK